MRCCKGYLGGGVMLALLWFLSGYGVSEGFAFDLRKPQQRGAGVLVGSSYDPSPAIGFVLLSGMAVYDYEQIMSHSAPEALRFKIEGNIGLSDHAHPRVLASANIFAMYYLRALANGRLRPYIEGGIGMIYTDFQVKDQGLRLNFNPQAGIGTEWRTPGGVRWYTALRAWHVSNSELHRDNRGINGVVLQCGRMF